MARKPNKGNSNAFAPTTFVQCSLDAEEKKHFAKWTEKEKANLDTLVIEVIQTGHKISFSFNDNSDSFIVSVTGKPEGCINASMCYTSHAKDYVTALWVALYKFHVIWSKGVWESVADEEDFG